MKLALTSFKMKFLKNKQLPNQTVFKIIPLTHRSKEMNKIRIFNKLMKR